MSFCLSFNFVPDLVLVVEKEMNFRMSRFLGNWKFLTRNRISRIKEESEVESVCLCS